MSFIYRACISICQRKGRSILFLGLFLIVFSLALAGFAIQNSAEEGKIEARKQIGTEVKLRRDNQKMKDAIQQGIFSMGSISKDTVNKIMNLPEVKSVQLEGRNGAVESNLKYVEPTAKNEFSGALMGDVDPADIPVFNLIGTNNTSGSIDFKNHDAKIVEGEGIAENSPDNAAVVEKTFAENNEMKVGDSFKIKGSSIDNKGNEVTLKIVGIYKTEKVALGAEQGFVLSQPENQIYVKFDSFQRTSDQAKIEEVSFNLKDPLQVEVFIKKAEELLTEDEKYFKLDAHLEQYNQMIGPIEKMAIFSSMMIKVILIAGAIILTLLILLSVRERKSEIGILLAIGESKQKIALQLVTEMLIISFLSFALSCATINVIGEPISNTILTKQIEASEDKPTFNEDDLYMYTEEEAEPLDRIELKVDASTIGQTAGIGLVLVLIATIIPTLIIVSTDPKDLFAQKE